jgi:hypothetical protein
MERKSKRTRAQNESAIKRSIAKFGDPFGEKKAKLRDLKKGH